METINKQLATLSEDLQILALRAIKEEHERFKREDFTDEEAEMFNMVNELGKGLMATTDRLFLRCITNG